MNNNDETNSRYYCKACDTRKLKDLKITGIFGLKVYWAGTKRLKNEEIWLKTQLIETENFINEKTKR